MELIKLKSLDAAVSTIGLYLYGENIESSSSGVISTPKRVPVSLFSFSPVIEGSFSNGLFKLDAVSNSSIYHALTSPSIIFNEDASSVIMSCHTQFDFLFENVSGGDVLFRFGSGHFLGEKEDFTLSAGQFVELSVKAYGNKRVVLRKIY